MSNEYRNILISNLVHIMNNSKYNNSKYLHFIMLTLTPVISNKQNMKIYHSNYVNYLLLKRTETVSELQYTKNIYKKTPSHYVTHLKCFSRSIKPHSISSMNKLLKCHTCKKIINCTLKFHT